MKTKIISIAAAILLASFEFGTWNLGLGTSCLAQGAWTQKSSFAGTPRYGAVGFSIGTKGYIGTGVTGAYQKDLWEYDTSADSWTQKADFPDSARTGAVGFSIAAKGYIGTGLNFTQTPSSFQDFWEYDPATNSWAQKANFPGTIRYYAVGFSIGTKGYIGTGTSAGPLYSDFWEYNPSSDSWIQKASFGGGNRYGAAGCSVGTKGYIGTGSTSSTMYYNDWWEYDPAADAWTQKATLPANPRMYAAAFSMNGKAYLGAGWDGAKYNDFWEFNPIANNWAQKANFGGTPRWQPAAFSIGTKGYMGTGYDDLSGYVNDFWEYDPTGVTAQSEILNPPSAILIYPTVSSGKFTIQAGSEQWAAGNQYKIEIYNVLGKEILSTNINTKLQTLNLNEAGSGIYFVKLNTESKQYIQKIIIH